MAETDTIEPSTEGPAIPLIPDNRGADPTAYAETSTALVNAMLNRQLPALEVQRQLKIIGNACEECTGLNLKEAGRERLDPLIRFDGLMEAGEGELRKLQRAVKRIDNVRISMRKKKRWLEVIDETIALQRECRGDHAKAWTYIGRDSETGKIFKMDKVHLSYFDVWADTTCRNSLVMAPPGHAKTTSMRGEICCEIGDDPRLRCLLLADAKAKASKDVMLLKVILRSPRYRAIYPDVRVLGRSDGAKDTSMQFTVARVNTLSREPTIEGAAISSMINGNGYDRIFADDVSSPDCKHHPAVRRDTQVRWTGVVEERLRDPTNARIRMICTPWHEEDVAGIIMRDVERGHLSDWLVAVDQFRIKDDSTGNPISIWDRFSVAHYTERRARLGRDYDLNYRLVARRKQDRVVTRVHYYHSEQNNMTTDRDRELHDALSQGERWLSIDPAATGGQASSDNGIIEAVLTANGYAFITDCELQHAGPVWMQNWIINRIYYATPRFAGIQIEAQGGIKGQVSLWVDHIEQALKEGQIPDLVGGEWVVTQQAPYTQHLSVVTTGTRMGGVGQAVGKRQRLAESAAYLESGMVRFAGQRQKTRHGSALRMWYRAVPSSAIEELITHILDFDGAGRLDGVDAVTQWVIYNSDRIVNPNLPAQAATEPAKPKGRFGDEMAAYIREVEQEYLEKHYRQQEADFCDGMSERAMACRN